MPPSGEEMPEDRRPAEPPTDPASLSQSVFFQLMARSADEFVTNAEKRLEALKQDLETRNSRVSQRMHAITIEKEPAAPSNVRVWIDAEKHGEVRTEVLSEAHATIVRDLWRAHALAEEDAVWRDELGLLGFEWSSPSILDASIEPLRKIRHEYRAHLADPFGS
jgi:hypothetical protein